MLSELVSYSFKYESLRKSTECVKINNSWILKRFKCPVEKVPRNVIKLRMRV